MANTKDVKKRFPSDTSIDEGLTFLNDTKISAELYAYLLANSYPVLNVDTGKTRTFCNKRAVNKTELADGAHFNCSRQTVANRLKYLAKRGYIEITPQGYYLNTPEKAWKEIPLDTVFYLIGIFKETVIKTYLYLGVMQEWCKKNYKRNYNFTKEEIIKHCGIPQQQGREYKMVDNILSTLNNDGLIKTRAITFTKGTDHWQKIEITEWSDSPHVNPTPHPSIEATKEEEMEQIDDETKEEIIHNAFEREWGGR